MLSDNALKLKKTPVSTKDVVNECVKIAEAVAKLRGASLRVEQKSPLPEYILSDEHRLKEMLLQLLNSTITLTVRGNVTAKLSTSTKDGKLSLKCSTTGSGMHLCDDDSAALLRAPFASRGLFVHSSLSLYICGQLAKLHGGNLKIKSKGRPSSSIVCTVPYQVLTVIYPNLSMQEAELDAMKDSLSDSEVHLQMDEEMKCNCPRVLIVDSNPINQFIASTMLDRLQVPNQAVQDGPGALDLLRQRSQGQCCNHFDMVLINHEDGDCIPVYIE
jgi:CheY-like chemotaxis protein